MSCVSIGAGKPTADERVDRLIADGTVTREDVAQIVQWIMAIEERLDAIKVPEMPDIPKPYDAAPLWDSLEQVARQLDQLRDDFTVSDVNDLKLYKDVNDLQNAVKKLQQIPLSPPVQKVEAHHNHVYTPESNRLLWIAIAVCFFVGALAHVV